MKCGRSAVGDLVGERRQLLVLRQRQHRDLDRREPRVEPQHRALLDLAVAGRRFVLVVRGEQERERRPVGAGRRLDHVRDVALVVLLVEVR